MKEFKQLGAYALIIKDEQILLIKKCGGPYDGKLDLPGGTIEFDESIEDALKRELLEEIGFDIKDREIKNKYKKIKEKKMNVRKIYGKFSNRLFCTNFRIDKRKIRNI